MSSGDFPRSVLVYGTGLIGCSFALAFKRQFQGIRVYGVDSPGILEQARQLGAVEPGITESADLIVLATPVGAILKLLEEFQPGESGLILDVGSTKVAICQKAEHRRLPFIGGHPMAGSERAGPEAASADLFGGEPFFLCPIATTPADALPKLTFLLRAIGAQPQVIDADVHDRLVAQLSHLPQILSTLLADQTGAQKELAGPGWRSMTRLGASPFAVWRDILQTSGSLPGELQAFISRLRSVLDALEAGNMQEIERLFERANHSLTDGAEDR